jgi:hypothetical protein
MNSPDEQMRAVKTALGKDDPAVAVLSTMTAKLGSMQDSIQDMSGKVDAIHGTGMILRTGAVRHLVYTFVAGIVIGTAGTWYWMSWHGFLGGFWANGINVQTTESRQRLQLKIGGNNYEDGDWILDQKGNKIGVWVNYRKESKP